MYLPINTLPGPLDAGLYLKRIGAAFPQHEKHLLLDHLQQRHLLSIPCETLDHASGVVPSLELPAIFQKVVRNHRGGDPFELGLLFAWLLRDHHFEVGCRIGRMEGNESNAGSPILLLSVELDGETLLVDVGCSTGISSSMRLSPGSRATTREGEIEILSGEKESLRLERIGPEGRDRDIRIASEPADETSIFDAHREFAAAIAGRPASATILTDGGFARLTGADLLLPRQLDPPKRRTLSPDEIPYFLEHLFEIEIPDPTWGKRRTEIDGGERI